MTTNAIELNGIEKSFGPVEVLKGVSLSVPTSRCYGLVGDNGAGKSTLLKILSGVHPRDAGQILLEGEPADFHTAIDARLAGIEMIYQDLALAEDLDAASNIFLGRERHKGRGPGLRRLDHKRMHAEAAEVLESVGSPMPTNRKVKSLSGGERQLVAVARALEFSPRILLMDEPTAALSVEKVNVVNRLIAALKDRGVSMILVSHRFTDLIQVADTIGVLVHGRIVDEFDAASHSMDDMTTRIVRLMSEAAVGVTQ
ncbi:MAG: ATP-binding cassette domain-containing protein [bacterium]|nr:ATP-binding cassette domain-containing protein [bacterium]MCY3953100.1 ATP-binding cassette domain-containing protein [bacterium]